MLKQAKEILEYVQELEDKYGSIEPEFKALFLEKKLNEIFGEERFQGAWLRELGKNRFSFGHRDCLVECRKTASNAVELTLIPCRFNTM